ncbi:MAG: MGMT family protein [Alcanivoracaceae bacterium]|nr:MGMT family protein [Alcanivoracaceae bacterium]
MAINTDAESDFARAVYQLVGSIPAGCIASYGQIATLAGFPQHARFVGKLMSNLPNDTRLPWWRVLRSNGEIALPGSAGEEQRQRLEKEGVLVLNLRVSVKRFGWRLD